MKKFIVFLLIIVIFITFWLYSSYSSALKYVSDPSSSARVSVDIPEGSTGDEIATLLKEAALIQNKMAFSFYLKQNELDNELKAGRYVFQENSTLPEIANALVSGGAGESAVTLLEGWTAQQMADYLDEKGVTTAEAFMDCVKNCRFSFNFLPSDYLEGFLYPDTYFINYDSYSDESFIRQLVSTFETKLSEQEWADINDSDRSLEEIIIMASIVEREERNSEEKATVAGILWNRFDAGEWLGADATVLYALGRTNGGLSAKDLKFESPYNTRKNKGLPPTPISNPSVDSIRAALYPEETDYMYYLHDSEGGIHYAETLEGHNENKAEYID